MLEEEENNGMSNAENPDPERPDEDNPECTAEDFARARPAAEVLPEYIGQKATDELMRGTIGIRADEDRRAWEELLASGQARMRDHLRAEGIDPDRMSEEEQMDYVNRAIHEYREEERQRQAEGEAPS